MKIVFLSDDFPPQSFGGAGISTYELARGTKEAGHDVYVITTCRAAAEAGESVYEGIKVFKIASDYPSRWRWYVCLYNPSTIRQLRQLLAQIRPDVVSVNNVHQYLSFYSLKVAKQYADTVMFTARDVMTFNFSKLETKRYLETFDAHTTWLDHIKQARRRWNPFRNLVIRHYLHYADKIFAISKSLKRALEQNGIDNVDVAYNGINLKNWSVTQDEVVAFKMAMGLTNKKILLFSGRLSPSKGAVKAVDALALVAKKEPNVILLVAGSIDDYARAMQSHAAHLGVQERLLFTGWIARDKMPVVYAAADIVLMPSICLDTFGRVNIEAMASRKPVIGTCYGGTPEVIVDGVTGYVINPLYPEEIAEKAVVLLSDSGKAQILGEAGYNRVEQVFTINNTVEVYFSFYRILHAAKS